MDLIQSDYNQASAIATNLANALNSLPKNKTLSKASRTTVAGNQQAQASSDKGKLLVASFITALNRDSANIRSVAKEFEAIDQRLNQSLMKVK